jgi:hypothetical protein
MDIQERMLLLLAVKLFYKRNVAPLQHGTNLPCIFGRRFENGEGDVGKIRINWKAYYSPKSTHEGTNWNCALQPLLMLGLLGV